MKHRILSLALASVLTMALAGCGTSSGDGDTRAPGSDGERITINIMWQQEVTESFMDGPIAVMKDRHPNLDINLTISPQAFSEINNLMATGNAPDIFFTWFSEVDYYGMMREGLLNPVDGLLAMQNAEETGTVGDTILVAGLEQGAYEDSHYLLPVTQYSAVNFYNSAFLRENDIAANLSTMDEFAATCAAVSGGTDAAPIVYAGVYSFMPVDAFIFPLIHSTDPAAAAAINSAQEGAWLQDSVVRSVEAWESLVQDGYVTKDSLAMDHIQSQIDFINGRAAFVPAGTWLEGEMEGQWPADFELTPFLAPTFDGGTPSVVPVIEYMILPKQANDDALPYVYELLQEFYSQENALRCLEETGALMAFETVGDDLKTLLPASMQAAFALTDTAEKVLPAYKLTNKQQFTESTNLVNALTAGEITAREFCEKMEELA